MSFRPGVLYHPNVSKDGEICSDTIAKSFGPTKNVTDLARMVSGSGSRSVALADRLCLAVHAAGYRVLGDPESGVATGGAAPRPTSCPASSTAPLSFPRWCSQVEAAHLMATALPTYEEAARKMAAGAPQAKK